MGSKLESYSHYSRQFNLIKVSVFCRNINIDAKLGSLRFGLGVVNIRKTLKT